MSIYEIIKNMPDKEDKTTLDLFDIVGDIKQLGFLDKDKAIRILKWKSPRPLIRYESNSELDFIDITKLAFGTQNDKLKIHILTSLMGVSYPAASALLMFYDKTIFPVIDIRVWKELYNAGLVSNNERGQGFTLEQWWTYVKIIRKISHETNLTARQVEKRLFDYNKVNQKGTLYKTKNK
ncbi:hypothetical protein [Gaoshiqia sp. Z1-71]|uniref:hypothetical protein n=1 Tax=Gaoshiqia hydrogeniformans TaxID=3290090 RepID=UPI003BF7FE0F